MVKSPLCLESWQFFICPQQCFKYFWTEDPKVWNPIFPPLSGPSSAPPASVTLCLGSPQGLGSRETPGPVRVSSLEARERLRTRTRRPSGDGGAPTCCPPKGDSHTRGHRRDRWSHWLTRSHSPGPGRGRSPGPGRGRGRAGRGRTLAAPTRGRPGLAPRRLLTRSPRRPERPEPRPPARRHFRDRSRPHGGPGVSVLLRRLVSVRGGAPVRGPRTGTGSRGSHSVSWAWGNSWSAVGGSAEEATGAGKGGRA